MRLIVTAKSVCEIVCKNLNENVRHGKWNTIYQRQGRCLGKNNKHNFSLAVNSALYFFFVVLSCRCDHSAAQIQCLPSECEQQFICCGDGIACIFFTSNLSLVQYFVECFFFLCKRLLCEIVKKRRKIVFSCFYS